MADEGLGLTKTLTAGPADPGRPLSPGRPRGPWKIMGVGGWGYFSLLMKLKHSSLED